jgi:hypothetical protein
MADATPAPPTPPPFGGPDASGDLAVLLAVRSRAAARSRDRLGGAPSGAAVLAASAASVTEALVATTRLAGMEARRARIQVHRR